jgi:hypothetical protein
MYLKEPLTPDTAVVFFGVAAVVVAFYVLEMLWAAGKYHWRAWRVSKIQIPELSAVDMLKVNKHYKQAMTEIDAYLAFKQRLDDKKAKVARRGLKWQNLRKM